MVVNRTTSGVAAPIRANGRSSAARTQVGSAPGASWINATNRSSPSESGTPTSTARSTPGTCNNGSYNPG